LVLLAVLSTCSHQGGDRRTLCLALETSPNKLDPAYVVDVEEGLVCSMIFQGLVRFSPHGRVIPDAARSWKILQEGKKYVFHLDTRTRFSNGRELSAKDVLDSFQRVLSPRSSSPRKWVLERIRGAGAYMEGRAERVSGLHIPDDSTVVVELEKPFKPFLMLLGMPAAMIVPAEACSDLASLPVGSGAWQLERWERGDKLVLVPNRFNPGRSRKLDRIEFRIIPEAFTRIAEFESGTLDILHIPVAELHRFINHPRYKKRVQEVTDLRVVYIGLNNRKPLLEDLRVRKALNLAVDVDRIIDVLLDGQAVRAAGAIPPGLAGYKKRSSFSYDPAEAKRLLGEAGVGDGFAFSLWLRDSPEGNLVCEAVQGYLKQVGIDAKLVKREWSAFKEAVSSGKVDAFFIDWYADYPDAENFLFPLFYSGNAGGGGNRAFFANDTVDSLILYAQGVLDEQRSSRLYAEVDSTVYAQAPWLFLYFPKSFYAVSDQVDGYKAAVIYMGEDYTSVSKSATKVAK
jgi:ABC-type transport system substrate-binding protein